MAAIHGSEREEILDEMHKQLKTASRIISSLNSKVEDLTKQNADLSAELSSVRLVLKDNRIKDSKSEAPKTKDAKPRVDEMDDDTGGLNADKKIKLAQDQMAKLMLKNRKEVQDWSSKCSDLERNLQKCKERHQDSRLLDSIIL